jgi:hypothetical protein
MVVFCPLLRPLGKGFSAKISRRNTGYKSGNARHAPHGRRRVCEDGPVNRGFYLGKETRYPKKDLHPARVFLGFIVRSSLFLPAPEDVKQEGDKGDYQENVDETTQRV